MLILCECAGGYAGLQRVMQWNLEFMARSDQGEAYLELANRWHTIALSARLACGPSCFARLHACSSSIPGQELSEACHGHISVSLDVHMHQQHLLVGAISS